MAEKLIDQIIAEVGKIRSGTEPLPGAIMVDMVSPTMSGARLFGTLFNRLPACQYEPVRHFLHK